MNMITVLFSLLWCLISLNIRAYTLDQLKQVENLVPVLIIGSGPAGQAAATYTIRAKMATVVVRGHEPGGQLMGSTWVENMPGVEPATGHQIMEAMELRNMRQQVQFIDGKIERITPTGNYFIVHTDTGLQLHALTVIIATGATARTLQIPGESNYLNNGVFTCAVCDCRQATDKDVMVVGGGDSAIETVMHLAPYARSITLVVRKGHLRAAAVMQDRLKEYSMAQTLFNKQPIEIQGDDTGIQSVLLQDTITRQETVRPIDCVFLAIGHVPHSEPFSSLVSCDAHGYINVLGRSQKTSVPGIFAAGDVVDSVYRQAGSATGDAVKAGLDAIAYLHEHGFSEHIAQALEPYYWKN
jgi:thioredoxin reductase (NADPH)